MPSTYSPNLRIELQAIGENRSTWGTKANTDYTLLEQAVAGLATVTIADANLTLTALNGATDQARAAILNFTGSQTAARTVTIPTVSKIYLAVNSTTGGFAVNIKTSTGTTYSLPAGAARIIYCDGTNTQSANVGVAEGGTGGTTIATAQAGLSVDNKIVYATKITNYTAVAADNNAVFDCTTTLTLALTAATTLGSNWHLWVYASNGNVTIDPSGAELINGATTLVIPTGSSALVICTGTAFKAFIFGDIASGIHSATAKSLFADADELGLWNSVSGTSAKMTWADAKWQAKGIGEIYMVDTSLVGVDIPPSSTTATVWIELTAGLTGAGGFNNGKLTSESVTGSAPLVAATAVISVSGSALNGKTVNLINTEGRILRPSASPGTLQNDALQQMTGTWGANRLTVPGSSSATGVLYDAGSQSTGVGSIDANGSSDKIGFDASRVARTSTETRMKNVGVKAYMRVK